MTISQVKTPTVGTPAGNPKTQGTSATGGAKAISPAAAQYAKQAQVSPGASPAAQVQISSRAKEMNQARKIAEDTPPIREDKVAFFKDKIAKGDYTPSSEKIADGIVREAIKDHLSSTPEVALGEG